MTYLYHQAHIRHLLTAGIPHTALITFCYDHQADLYHRLRVGTDRETLVDQLLASADLAAVLGWAEADYPEAYQKYLPK